MKITIERKVVNGYHEFIGSTMHEVIDPINLSRKTSEKVESNISGFIAKASEFKSSSMHRVYVDEKTDEYVVQVDDAKLLEFLCVFEKHKSVFTTLFGTYMSFHKAYKGLLDMFSLSIVNMLPRFNQVMEDLNQVKEMAPSWQDKNSVDLTLVDKVA